MVSYELLIRIADGLKVPGGWLGLAFDEATAALIEAQGGDVRTQENGRSL